VGTGQANTYTTGAQDFTGATSTLVSTQTAGDSSTKAANTSFVTTAVNNAIAGVNPAVAVLAASTANVTGTYTSVGSGIGDTFTVTATGAFTLDGIAINTIGQRVLLKNQTDATQNGIYTATIVGASLVSPVFTRALDYDQPSDVNNTGNIPVQSGTVNSTTGWLLTSNITSIGPAGSAFTYTQFSLNPTTVQTTTANQQMFLSNATGLTLANSTNYFMPISGASVTISQTEKNSAMWLPRAATITGMYVNTTVVQPTSAVTTVTLQECSPSSGICTSSALSPTVSCAVNATQFGCSTTGLTTATIAGDLIVVKMAQTGAAAGTSAVWSVSLTYY
jgi:hypothetical protein